MNKKNIAIIVGVILVAIIIVLLVLFGSKKEVTFDSVGGSAVDTQEVKFFRKATKPADPTREGYVFDDWYLDDEEYDFDKRVTKDIKLVARWSKGQKPDAKFTVKFNTGEDGSEVEDAAVGEDGKLVKPADPTRDGYTFVAWQYNGKDFDFNTKVTKNMTLTAKWEKNDSQNPGTTKPNTKPVSKPNGGNAGGNAGGNTETPQQPEEPKPLSDYRAVCEKIADSSANECYIRIKDKNGNNVGGTVNVKSLSTGATGTKSAGAKVNADVIDINNMTVASVK